MLMKRLVRRTLACGGTGLFLGFGACLSVDWPPTVESGFGGGHAAGSNEPDASHDAGEDSGTASDGGPVAGFTCTIQAGLPSGYCTTYLNLTAAMEMVQSATCTMDTGTPSVAPCVATDVIGCCTTAGSSYQTCFYTGSTFADSTLTNCVSGGGTFAATPQTF